MYWLFAYEKCIEKQEKLISKLEELNLKVEEFQRLEEIKNTVSYSLNDLIVADFDVAGEKQTYILESFGIYYEEVHGYFNAYSLQDA